VCSDGSLHLRFCSDYLSSLPDGVLLSSSSEHYLSGLPFQKWGLPVQQSLVHDSSFHKWVPTHLASFMCSQEVPSATSEMGPVCTWFTLPLCTESPCAKLVYLRSPFQPSGESLPHLHPHCFVLTQLTLQFCNELCLSGCVYVCVCLHHWKRRGCITCL
jgi:hypothetical protein